MAFIFAVVTSQVGTDGKSVSSFAWSWTSRKNSLEVIELSSMNKVSLGFLLYVVTLDQ